MWRTIYLYFEVTTFKVVRLASIYYKLKVFTQEIQLWGWLCKFQDAKNNKKSIKTNFVDATLEISWNFLVNCTWTKQETFQAQSSGQTQLARTLNHHKALVHIPFIAKTTKCSRKSFCLHHYIRVHPRWQNIRPLSSLHPGLSLATLFRGDFSWIGRKKHEKSWFNCGDDSGCQHADMRMWVMVLCFLQSRWRNSKSWSDWLFAVTFIFMACFDTQSKWRIRNCFVNRRVNGIPQSVQIWPC